jgi:hypothetical protein
MTGYETYRAQADPQRAQLLAATASPFAIEVRFLGGLNARQRTAFTRAADRWTRIIVGDLPSVRVDGELVDDLLILAQGTPIDGQGRVLGQAGPTHLRPETDGASALLPAKGLMSFDTADLDQMDRDGTLDDVIAHEMGHVLGIGTLWQRKGLLEGAGTSDPQFTGQGAVGEYRQLVRGEGDRGVPVESTGGPGTADGHWRESALGNELMSGFIGAPGNPLSRITAASLGDVGYEVDVAAAEPYTLPDLLERAEAGALVARGAPDGAATVLPVIPMTLPPDSLGTSP